MLFLCLKSFSDFISSLEWNPNSYYSPQNLVSDPNLTLQPRFLKALFPLLAMLWASGFCSVQFCFVFSSSGTSGSFSSQGFCACYLLPLLGELQPLKGCLSSGFSWSVSIFAWPDFLNSLSSIVFLCSLLFHPHVCFLYKIFTTHNYFPSLLIFLSAPPPHISSTNMQGLSWFCIFVFSLMYL